MKVIITENYEEMSKKAAEVVVELLKQKPQCVLGLATGSTPIGLYQNLIKAYKDGIVSFDGVTSANLDEYVGLYKEHVQSYAYFMRTNLFDHVDIKTENLNIPDGSKKDLEAECARYSAFLQSNPQDLQVLGIGSNGHIGFNEPGTPFDSKTHLVNLTESTKKDNSRLFDSIDEVPTQAVTMGIAEIMKSKKILILASGENKANAVYQTVKGEISESCPASVLQNHPDCILIADKAAAKLL